MLQLSTAALEKRLAHAWLIRNALKFPNHKFKRHCPEKTQAKKGSMGSI